MILVASIFRQPQTSDTPGRVKTIVGMKVVFEINMPALVQSMQRRQGTNMVFSTRYAYAVSYGSFLMMTWQSGEKVASSGQNSSLMPTTLFNLA